MTDLRPVPDQLLTRPELAQQLRVSVRTVDRMIRDGLPTVRYGRRIVRIKLREAVEWAQDQDEERRVSIFKDPNDDGRIDQPHWGPLVFKPDTERKPTGLPPAMFDGEAWTLWYRDDDGALKSSSVRLGNGDQ